MNYIFYKLQTKEKLYNKIYYAYFKDQFLQSGTNAGYLQYQTAFTKPTAACQS